MLKLNLGCGSTKLEGYVNVDLEASCNPDLVFDFTKLYLPYEPDSVDEIVMFHTIEHIPKTHHVQILDGFWKVLKPGARLILSYPNFWECAQNWKNNYKGDRDFWHRTLYGRQLYPSDFHVCAMDPTELEVLLRDLGFINCLSHKEPVEDYNSITSAVKGTRTTYMNLLVKDLETTIIK